MLDKEKKNDNEPPDAHLYENMMEKIDKSINFMMDERIHSSPVFKGIQDDGDTNLSIEIPVDQKPILEVHQPKGRNSRWKWKTGEREKIKLSALMMAASQGFEDEVKRLLQQDDANPNGEPNKWGPLHISAYKGHVDVVRYLLEFPGTDITCKDSKGRTALHLATLKGKYEVLKLLLGVSRIDICAVDNDGFTALHTACASPFIGEIPPGKFIQCIYLLMSREGMNLNVPDKAGITALGRALMASDKDLALAMLEHEKGHLLNVDAFIPRHYRKTVRDVLPSIYPDLDIKLPNPLQEDEHSPKPSIRLLASLQKGDFNTFQALLLTQSFVSDISEHFYYEPYHCTILEIACQIRHRKEFIKALLTAGADPNTKNKITNLPVLHLVVKIGNLDALKILLKAKNTDINIRDDNGLTPLHCLASIRIPCSNETDSEILQHSINLLLEESNLIHNKADDLRQKIDLNAVANNGETPLHLAARMGEKDILLTLLRNGADVIHKTVGGKPALAYIDPKILENYLDECIETNEESPMHEDFMLIFNYNFLRPTSEDSEISPLHKKLKHDPEMSTIKFLNKRNRFRYLLAHPVISSFLQLKWSNICYMYSINFFLYTVFIIALTWYCAQLDDSEDVSVTHTFSITILSTLLLGIFIYETYLFHTSPKTYIKHKQNWLLWVVILLTMNVCLARIVTIIPHCESIAVLVAWIFFVSLLGGFPSLSIQLEMLKTVAWNFFKFILCYSPLFFAFGISFYTMFRYSGSTADKFFSTTFGMSMLKIFVMFTGELEITDIPFDKVPYVSQIILTVFVFLMAVVLINLLNGLAVSDAQTIMNDAEVWSHSARVTLICYLKEMNYDRVGFFSTLKSIPGKKLKIFPNRKCGEVEIHGKVYQNRKIDPDTIQDAILLVTKTRESKCKSNAMKNSGQCEFRRKIADLERNQEIINKKLNELSEQLNFHKDSKNIY